MTSPAGADDAPLSRQLGELRERLGAKLRIWFPDDASAVPVATTPTCLLDQAARTASALLVLLTDPQRWMRRRVESIEVLDDRSVHRRVSIDLAVPERLGSPVDAVLLPYLPLTFLKKAVLKNFDLRDSDARPVPMLTKSENGQVAGDVLVVAAEGVLGQALPVLCEARLRRVAENDAELAQDEISAWAVLAGDQADPHQDVWACLTDDDGFMNFAQSLVENFVLLAVTAPRPGERRLMKLSYDEPFEPGSESLVQRLATAMGWRRKEVRFLAPAANLAASFHLEVLAPTDMEIDVARLSFETAPGQPTASVPQESFDGPQVQRAHLYASAVQASYSGQAFLYFRCRRPGFLRGAVLVGFLMVAVLALGYAFFGAYTSQANSQTAGALLILGPTLFAASLIRPGEHRLVTSVLAGVRVALVLQMTSTVFAVSLLAGAGGDIRKCLWLGALIAAGVAQLALVVSYVYPRTTEG